jgi:hypothetical protein
MIRVRQIQYRITNEYQQLLMFAMKRSRQRTVISLYNDAFPHPLPKLCLGGPKLFAISADDQRGLLLALLCFIFALTHNSITSPCGPMRGLTPMTKIRKLENRFG